MRDNIKSVDVSDLGLGARAHAAEGIRLAAVTIGGPNAARMDENWRTITGATAKLQDEGVRICHATLGRRLGSRPRIPVLDAFADNGALRPHYHMAHAREASEDLALLDRLHRQVPQDGFLVLNPEHVDPAHGVSEDDIGKKFATIPTIAQYHNISEKAVERRIGDERKLDARNFRGKPVVVYDFEAITARLKVELLDARETREVKIDKNGYYENEDGKWSLIEVFYNSLPPEIKAKTSEQSVRRHANKHCQSLDALDRELRPNCKVYLLEDLQKLSVLSQETKVAENGIYTDPQTNEEWASLGTWEKVFRVSTRALMSGIQNTFGELEYMTTKPLLSVTKRPHDGFSRAEIEQALLYIFEAENLTVNGVSTIIEETSEGIRECLSVTTDELEAVIPQDRVSRKQIQRKLKDHLTEVIDRESGAPRQAFDLSAAIQQFHAQIADLLAAIEKTDDADEVTDDKGRWITISKFLNERRASNENIENPRRFIANTDQAQRIRRMNSQNELTYLYLESDLQKAQLTLKAA